MWRKTIAIHNVLKKKSKFSTNLIIKKTRQKNFWKKKQKKRYFFGKKEKKQYIWGKLKLNSQPAQYWKNKFDNDNLKKNMWGKTAAK